MIRHIPKTLLVTTAVPVLLLVYAVVVLLGHQARRIRMRGWMGFPALALLALILVGADLDLLAVTALLMGIARIPVALATART